MNSIIVSIGDELLIGQTVNTNATWMGRELNKIGVEVVEVLTISDTETAIEAALKYAGDKVPLVLLTGGLGPTKDDITKKVFARYFNAPLIENKTALENVKRIFKEYNSPMLPINNLQALVPSGCEMLLNKVGTAPGMWMENEQAIYVSMPGVPHEMKYLIKEEVSKRIVAKFDLPFIVHHSIMLQGLGESYLAEEISDIEDGLPSYLKLAYLPNNGMVTLRLTGRGGNEEKLRLEIKAIFDRIIDRVSENVFSDTETTIEEVVGNLLRKHNQTISTAESFTSGAIASKITRISGASNYFKGSVVSYSDEVKVNQLGVSQSDLDENGAVSEKVAKQMAVGVQQLLGTDFAISTSGIAGPEGGTEEIPIGTVWVGIAFPGGVTAHQFNLGKGRERIVKKAVLLALGLLLKELKQGI
jgi:nicotinamide-nucleotide amidase